MMEQSVNELASAFERLDRREQDMLLRKFRQHFGREVSISSDGLRDMNADEVESIRAAIVGLVLTKEQVPDILGMYEKVRGTQLPARASFGRKSP